MIIIMIDYTILLDDVGGQSLILGDAKTTTSSYSKNWLN